MIRQHVPRRMQGLVRETYIRTGAMTAAHRLEPEFMIIGSHRCGTTSLFSALSEHPQVMRPPVNKGTDYFSLYYDHTHAWYRGHFPLARGTRVTTHGTSRPITFEACTYYLFHPFALARIADDYPTMKLVVMLRDPVERAFSAYKHEVARGFEWEQPFERALELEDDRLVGEVERMGNDLTYESFAHRHHAYRHRGLYGEQIRRIFEHFPRQQVHVLDSESFFTQPAEEYQHLLGFLALEPFTPQRFDRHNARPSSPMEPGTQKMLEDYYAPQNGDLAQLLGRNPSWVR